MPTFKVEAILERKVTFYVEAENESDVEAYMANRPDDWTPGDVEGLIDVVSDEQFVDWLTSEADENEVIAEFCINASGELEDMT